MPGIRTDPAPEATWTRSLPPPPPPPLAVRLSIVAIWNVQDELAAPDWNVSSRRFATVESTATVATVADRATSTVNRPVATSSPKTWHSPMIVPDAVMVRIVTMASKLNGWAVTDATALGAPLVGIVPVRVVGPIRMRKVLAPGVPAVVPTPAARTRNDWPTARLPAPSVAATTTVSVLAIAADAA